MTKVTESVAKQRAPEAPDADGGPSMNMKVEEDSEEFQERQQILDMEYQSPPAPPPMVHHIPDKKGVS